jgi:hypothetical protein
MARSLVELAALVSDLRIKVAIGVKEHDLAKIDAATIATNFATRWEGAPTETKATNIMTLLERFDRDFTENKTGKPVSTIHATLSEYTHPNWSGMAGFFSLRNDEGRTDSFSVQPRDKAKLYVTIATGCLCLPVIEVLLREILDLAAQL